MVAGPAPTETEQFGPYGTRNFRYDRNGQIFVSYESLMDGAGDQNQKLLSKSKPEKSTFLEA
jgi:hypothetical protein